MANNATTTKPRLLLNAEPFGFGPSAAIAILQARLVPIVGRLGYIGGGHTLDLQQTLPYYELYDTTNLTTDATLELLRRVAPHYDAFVTAMDFATAELAERAGLPVIIYDALTWYWSTIPGVAQRAALYIAQDFFDVKDRVDADTQLRERSIIVPPIIPAKRKRRAGKHVLVNLGGLQNPFWKLSDATAYARLMLTVIRASLPDNQTLIIATSQKIAAELADPDVKTYDHETMLDLMASAAYAFMTTGLGNVYDAAATDVPTLWLPAANDSQAKQIRLLAKHGYCDAWLDWETIGLSIDYTASQSVILQEITHAVHRTATDPFLQQRLSKSLATQSAHLGAQTGKASPLADRFGHGGMEQAALAILQRCRENR